MKILQIYQCNVSTTGHKTVPLSQSSNNIVRKSMITNENNLITNIQFKKELDYSSSQNPDVWVNNSKNIPIRFNKMAELDIDYVKDHHVHLLDCLTKYSASISLSSKNTDHIINVITENWTNIFGLMAIIGVKIVSNSREPTWKVSTVYATYGGS